MSRQLSEGHAGKMRVVRIKEEDWLRIQTHAVAFEPFHKALTRVMDLLEVYAEGHYDPNEDPPEAFVGKTNA